jgi:hypothetical protein
MEMKSSRNALAGGRPAELDVRKTNSMMMIVRRSEITTLSGRDTRKQQQQQPH